MKRYAMLLWIILGASAAFVGPGAVAGDDDPSMAVTVTPADPTSSDEVLAKVYGSQWSNCVGLIFDHADLRIVGKTIYLDLHWLGWAYAVGVGEPDPNPPPGYRTYEHTESLGTLRSGTYTLKVRNNGNVTGSVTTSFTVSGTEPEPEFGTPEWFEWWRRERAPVSPAQPAPRSGTVVHLDDPIVHWGRPVPNLPPSGADPDVSLPFEDDFESYAVGTWPSALWTKDAKARDDPDHNKIVLDPAGGENKVLKLYGTVGGCWAGLAYAPCDFVDSYVLTCRIRNGAEPRTGCHPDGATIHMRESPNWRTASRTLIRFRGEGTIQGGDGSILQSYLVDQWYDVKIQYTRLGGHLMLQYWIDGADRGRFIMSIPDPAVEDSYDHVGLGSQEGSAFFDDVRILAGPPVPDALPDPYPPPPIIIDPPAEPQFGSPEWFEWWRQEHTPVTMPTVRPEPKGGQHPLQAG